jgi:hypothetical protein
MRIPAAFALILGLAIATSACNKGVGGGGAASGDMSLGNASAKVTVNEFASRRRTSWRATRARPSATGW